MNIEFNFHIHHSGDVKEKTTIPVDLFCQKAWAYIEQTGGRKEPKTIENYKTALRSLIRYTDTERSTPGIDESAVEGYVHWLRSRGICPNTISCYLRSLRSLMSALFGKENVTFFFRNVFTGNAKTKKRSVNEEDIIKLQRLPLPASSYLYLARDLFLFCFYAQGLPFVDVVNLKKKNVVEGKIVYLRQKTGQRVIIPLDPLMIEIIERYDSDGDDALFPEIQPHGKNDYYYQLNRYNHALRVLSEKAGIKRLTSYVARHSWASLAYKSQVDISIISKALGHQNPQTTLIYVREIDDEPLAEANRKLLDRFRR